MPSLDQQIDRLIELGVHDPARQHESEIRSAVSARRITGETLLAFRPEQLGPAALAPVPEREGRPGFVVMDMRDVDQFVPIEAIRTPESMFHLVHGLDRGDDMAYWSPNEALPEIISRGRVRRSPEPKRQAGAKPSRQTQVMLGAVWQRRRIHFVRNVLAQVRKGSAKWLLRQRARSSPSPTPNTADSFTTRRDFTALIRPDVGSSPPWSYARRMVMK